MDSVDYRCFKVDVFVKRDVIEKRLLGRNRERGDGFASLTAGVEVLRRVNDVATDGDQPKSGVYVNLTAVHLGSPRYHGVLCEAQQETEVSEVNLVLVGAYVARAVVSVFRQVYVVRLESFRNHVERPISRPELKHSLSSVRASVGLDQGDFVIVFVDVFEPPIDRDVVDHDP